MADYIPSREPDKVAWLWNFANWLTADDGVHALAHGLTWEEACGFYSTVMQATMARLNAMKTPHPRATDARSRGIIFPIS